MGVTTINKFYNGLLLAISLVVCLLLMEVTLRFLFAEESTGDYQVWPPNLVVEFSPSSEVMPGISGRSRFIINELGVRGASFSEQDRYRILTVGGSTTECLYLDESEAWPHLLQEMLNEGFEDSPLWVGNVGKSGNNTRHHILQIEKLLDRYPDINLVVSLVGVNDLQIRLSRDDNYRTLDEEDSAYRRKLLNEAFHRPPGWDATFPAYKRTEIWRLLRDARQDLRLAFSRLVQDRAGMIYTRWRNHRQSAARIRSKLPDLSIALDEYRRNIHAIINLVEERNATIVFMTQPSMWRSDLPRELSNLLWSGGIGQYQIEPGREYYSVSALANAMNMYNEALLGVCDERRILCVDLALALTKDDTVFYDDFHFNESGARQAASVLARNLLRSNLLDL